VPLIVFRTNRSLAPKPARLPVSGVTKPIVMSRVDDDGPAPLIPEVHASSTPPAPIASAPAPAALSRLRRPIPVTGAVVAARRRAAFPRTVPSHDGVSDWPVMALPRCLDAPVKMSEQWQRRAAMRPRAAGCGNESRAFAIRTFVLNKNKVRHKVRSAATRVNARYLTVSRWCPVSGCRVRPPAGAAVAASPGRGLFVWPNEGVVAARARGSAVCGRDYAPCPAVWQNVILTTWLREALSLAVPGPSERSRQSPPGPSPPPVPYFAGRRPQPWL
jgi:hypothetical protein